MCAAISMQCYDRGSPHFTEQGGGWTRGPSTWVHSWRVVGRGGGFGGSGGAAWQNLGGAKLSPCPSIWQILQADLGTFGSLLIQN